MELQINTRNENMLGLSDNGIITDAMLKDLARKVVSQAKSAGITQQHRLIQIINWAKNPNNPGSWERDYKSYFAQLGNNPSAVLSDLKDRHPTIFGLPAKPQPKPAAKNQSSTLPAAATATQAGFSFGNLNPWWIGGGLLTTAVVAAIIVNR